MQTLKLGISPCPNDTFIFAALVKNLFDTKGLTIQTTLADVEELNSKALSGELDVVKISVAQYPRIAENYALLRCGGALGYGCGPIVVARPDRDATAPSQTVALPGAMTTAALLTELCGKFPGPRMILRYDEVMPAVVERRADLGVIIHEGRFTYMNSGLEKIFDLGAWWEKEKGLPIPLGAIAIRRDRIPQVKLVEELIRTSLDRAHKDPGTIWTFILDHAQEMSETVIREHIKTFVNDFSHDVGNAAPAVTELVETAAKAAGIALPDKPIFAS